MSDDRRNRLGVLFVTACLLLNYPLLGLVDPPRELAGMPPLFFYLFFVWLALIIAVALVVRNRNK